MTEKMSKDARRAFLLRSLGDNPRLLNYRFRSNIFDELVESGYDRNIRTFRMDMDWLSDTLGSQEHAIDRRTADAILIDSEIDRALGNDERPVEPITKLVEARGKLLGYGNTVVIDTPSVPKYNKYQQKEDQWHGNNQKPNSEQP